MSSTSHTQWDTIIKPQDNIFTLHLADIYRYRDLLRMLVIRDFKAQYTQTVLGPIWHLLQPLLTTIIFLFVFHGIAGIDTDGIEPILFYMSGLTIWNYFAACLTGTSNTFIQNAGIFGKVYFPRLIMPLSVVLSNLVRFGIQFLLLVAMMVWVSIRSGQFYIGWSWLLIPILILLMAGLSLGAGILISALTTKYRDLAVLLTFAVQLLMYLTPVAYPLSFASKFSYASWIRWNPLSPVVEGFRAAIFGKPIDWVGLGYTAVCMIILIAVGIVLFNKTERNFMDTV